MKKILVLTDFSKRAARAAELALEIASNDGAEIILFYSSYVLVPLPAEAIAFPYYQELTELTKENRSQLERHAENLKTKFSKLHGTEFPAIKVETGTGTLTENIHAICQKHKIWMIVMGGKGHETAMEHFLFGSETFEVMEVADCPLLLVPEGSNQRLPDKISFASELNWTDHQFMPALSELAVICDATLHVIHINPDNHIEVQHQWKNERGYEKIVKSSRFPVLSYTELEGKNVAECLEAYARKEDIGILALVHRKRSLLGRILHKSISKQLVNMHRTPILLLPGD